MSAGAQKIINLDRGKQAMNGHLRVHLCGTANVRGQSTVKLTSTLENKKNCSDSWDTYRCINNMTKQVRLSLTTKYRCKNMLNRITESYSYHKLYLA